MTAELPNGDVLDLPEGATGLDAARAEGPEVVPDEVVEDGERDGDDRRAGEGEAEFVVQDKKRLSGPPLPDNQTRDVNLHAILVIDHRPSPSS